MKKKDAGAMLEDLYPMKKCSLEREAEVKG